jgi:predicted O-methyltransferase YrrM
MMRTFRRVSNYLRAWSGLRRLRKLTLQHYSLEELVDTAMQYAGGFFAAVQVRDEIIAALKEVRALRPKYVVELGTAGGGTLLLWSRVADPQATLITIDLPGGAFGGGSSPLRVPLYKRLGLPGQKIHIVRADSHQNATLELAKRLLDGNAADFLFIDADHTESGVRKDYAMYSPLVRPGGLILFHDIAIQNVEYGVRKLWRELAAEHTTREFLGAKPFGLGLLYVSDKTRPTVASER